MEHYKSNEGNQLICYFYEAFSTAVRIKNEEIQENKKIPA
jgi:hypothetical protein